ncbi:hypothetical protein QBC32DRAFT_316257 [Pseudoneurospora amorphoporcata]|uniref:J domain-containing protein n=1 Tax=Pseudoneurospora amorphoporcata TaxID=241081 RepID=A0AAN6SDX3_9PEZI|nr:hypothetical protein QBC32DRAFT_316257 [Pseudoneurospora amorphoporcata]
MFDCYSTLGVSPYADAKTIKEAYDKLVNAHRELGDNSAEASTGLEKLEHAYELLFATTRRREYDLSVEQEYLRAQAHFIELQKDLYERWTSRPHDPKLLENHATLTRLAQTMAGLVRELKTVPDEGADWEEREQELEEEIGDLRKRVQNLQSLATYNANRIHSLGSELEQERKKARDAEAAREKSLAESVRSGILRHKHTTYIRVDRLRKALGTLDNELQSFREFTSLGPNGSHGDESTIIEVRHAHAAECRKVIRDDQ